MRWIVLHHLPSNGCDFERFRPLGGLGHVGGLALEALALHPGTLAAEVQSRGMSWNVSSSLLCSALVKLSVEVLERNTT